MKFGKMGLLLVGAGAFVLVLVSLGAVHSQQGTEADLLKTKLAAAQTKLTAVQTGPLTAEQATLQQQLDQALKDMAQAKDVFSKSSDSVATTGIIFKVAQEQGVSIDAIQSSGATSQMLEGITYTVLPVQIKVTGDVNSLITFITALNQELGTGVIQTAALNVPPSPTPFPTPTPTPTDTPSPTPSTTATPSPTPAPTSAPIPQPTVDIQMTIYTYRGN